MTHVFKSAHDSTPGLAKWGVRHQTIPPGRHLARCPRSKYHWYYASDTFKKSRSYQSSENTDSGAGRFCFSHSASFGSFVQE